MKYKMVWLCISLMGVVSVMPEPEVPQIRIPTLPSMAFKQLKSRLEFFPPLYDLFIELHSPAVRLQRRLYGRKRVEFDQALKLYELSSTLVRDLKRFNKKMKPRVPKAWWKRTEVIAPAVLTALTAAVVGGYVWRRKDTKKKAATVQQSAQTPSRDGTPLGSTGEGKHFDAPGVEAGATPLVLVSTVTGDDLRRTDDQFAGPKGSSLVLGATGEGQVAKVVVGGGQADDQFAGGSAHGGLTAADDLGVGGSAGAYAGAGSGMVLDGGASVGSTQEVAVARIESELASLSNDVCDLTYITELIQPESISRYRNKPMSFDSARMNRLMSHMPNIVSQISNSCNSVITKKSEGYVEEIIKRYRVIVNILVYLEQEETGTGRAMLRRILTNDLLQNVLKLLGLSKDDKRAVFQALVEPLHLQGNAQDTFNLVFPSQETRPVATGTQAGQSRLARLAALPMVQTVARGAAAAAMSAGFDLAGRVQGKIPQNPPVLLGWES
jgi:hypothetical protein